MYSLLLFFTLGSLWLFLRFLREGGESRKFPLALTACNLLLVYTHYYGWLVVGAQAVFLLLKNRRRLRPFLLGSFVVALCFAPWVYACATAAGEGGGLAQNIGWINRPRLSEFAQFFALPPEPFYFDKPSSRLCPLGGLRGLLARPAVALLPAQLIGESRSPKTRRRADIRPAQTHTGCS